MTVCNEEPFVAAAIESILNQTYRDFDFLIIDDASTDRSNAIAASYRDPRIRLVTNPTNLGFTRTLNRGLSMIASEYVARMDGDDVSYPARFEKQIAFLDAHRDVAVAGTQAHSIDVHGRRNRRVAWWHAEWRRPTSDLAMEWYRMFDTPLVHSSVMFRRAAVDAYDERYPLNQDAELWMRVARRHRIANLDEVLIGFRAHPKSMTGDPHRREREGYDALKIGLVHTLLREGLRCDVPRRWAELWTTGDDVHELANVIDQCAARFAEIHPESRDNRDIARHQASMLARMAAKKPSLFLLRRMFRRDAPTAFRFLTRLAAEAFR
jgi:glycosyltransferase involved in cell wall biosynthesis